MTSKEVQELTKSLELQHDGCALAVAIQNASSQEAALKMLQEIKIQNRLDHAAHPGVPELTFPELSKKRVVVHYVDFPANLPTEEYLFDSDAGQCQTTEAKIDESLARKSLIQQNALDKQTEDRMKHSEATLNVEISAWRLVGESNPDYLKSHLAELLERKRIPDTDDWHAAARDAIAMRTGLAEAELAKGIACGGDFKNKYILQGMGLDFGGNAMDNLARAKRYLSKVLERAPDLDEIQRRVESGLQTILGPHNIPLAYEELKRYANSDLNGHTADDMRRDLKLQIDTAPSWLGAEMLAKYNRDYALLSLAIASQPGSTVRSTVQEAERAIAASLRLDRKNTADAKALQAIARSLHENSHG